MKKLKAWIERSVPSSSSAATSRRLGMPTPSNASPALAEASKWLTGQMPQIRAVNPGISSKRRPSHNFSKPRTCHMELRILTWPGSSSWIVILACPSMRVTGSIIMVFCHGNFPMPRTACVRSNPACVHPTIHLPHSRWRLEPKEDNQVTNTSTLTAMWTGVDAPEPAGGTT